MSETPKISSFRSRVGLCSIRASLVTILMIILLVTYFFAIDRSALTSDSARVIGGLACFLAFISIVLGILAIICREDPPQQPGTFYGANIVEWSIGVIVLFVAALFFNDLRQMPILLLVAASFAQTLAYVRIRFVEKRNFSDVLAKERRVSRLPTWAWWILGVAFLLYRWLK